MTLFAKGVAASWMDETPNKGNNTSGNMAVTAIGTASVAHHIAIKIPIIATLKATADMPSGVSIKVIPTAVKGPRNKPTLW